MNHFLHPNYRGETKKHRSLEPSLVVVVVVVVVVAINRTKNASQERNILVNMTALKPSPR